MKDKATIDFGVLDAVFQYDMELVEGIAADMTDNRASLLAVARVAVEHARHAQAIALWAQARALVEGKKPRRVVASVCGRTINELEYDLHDIEPIMFALRNAKRYGHDFPVDIDCGHFLVHADGTMSPNSTIDMRTSH